MCLHPGDNKVTALSEYKLSPDMRLTLSHIRLYGLSSVLQLYPALPVLFITLMSASSIMYPSITMLLVRSGGDNLQIGNYRLHIKF